MIPLRKMALAAMRPTVTLTFRPEVLRVMVRKVARKLLKSKSKWMYKSYSTPSHFVLREVVFLNHMVLP